MAVGSKDLAAPKLRGMEDDELVNQLRSAKEELFVRWNGSLKSPLD